MKNTAQASSWDDWLWLGVICSFFFQLLTDFVAAVYAFGLLGTDIPPEIVTVLILFAPVLLLLMRRAPRQSMLLGLIVLTGIVELLLDTRGRMLVSGLGVGACLVWLPAWLFERSHTDNASGYLDLGLGISLGVALWFVFRAISLIQGSLVVLNLMLLVVIAGWSYWRWTRQPDRTTRPATTSHPRFRIIAGLTLGLMAALIMLYFAFISPNVIARWTGEDYGLILILVVLALIGFTLGYKRIMSWPRSVIGLWNVAFLIALTATLWAYHIDFPANPAAYPLAEPIAPVWASVATVFTCVLFPVVLLDISLYGQELIARRPSLRSLGGSFTLAGLFLLLMIFAQVFTTVYDYIPVVGPLFRDRFWLVFAVLGSVMIVPLFLVRSRSLSNSVTFSKSSIAFIAALGALTVFPVVWPTSAPVDASAEHTLRVLTYNIQQGYSADGQVNYSGQLTLMRRANPDVIGLQESDTNRIAGGNFDLVRYFADNLHLYSYYGPKVGAGTFGVALLSRYPIENPRVVYFYSTGEQTAAIIAQITVGSQRFEVVVTHLGNGGPLVQQQDLLQTIDGDLPKIVMGDFNFRPDTEQYRLTRTHLDDAWLLRWPTGVDEAGLDLHDRIDHIFVSPGTTVNDARYVDTPDSDHPLLWAEIGW